MKEEKGEKNKMERSIIRYIDEKDNVIEKEKSIIRYIDEKDDLTEEKAVIYILTCRKTNKSYIGQTKRRFNERLSGHISHSKSKNKVLIGEMINMVLKILILIF